MKNYIDIRDEKEKGIYDEVFNEKVYGGVSPGEVVVDIGANVGYFSVFAAQSGAKKVLAFEPESKNFARLEAHAAHYPQIEAVNEAVRGVPGPMRLFINPGNNGGHNAFRDMQAGFQDVQGTTLDGIVAKLGHVDMLKMDCEGSEHSIVTGSSEETLKAIGRIMMEFHPIATMDAILAKLRPHFSIQIRDNQWDHSIPYIWALKKN